MEEWKEYKLGEVCKSIADGDHMPPPKVNSGIPFVTISNIVDCRLDFSNTYYVPQEYYDSLDVKRKPQQGDTIYSVVGTFGKPVYIKDNKPFVFQRHIAILRPDESKIDPQFLFYTLLSPQFYRKADVMAIGAVQRTISLTSLRNATIQVPPIDIQKGVVDALRFIDDKIEVNRRINDNLEQQAQALFKSWFVDFEPFKDGEFVDSELGRIPKGWRVGTLMDLGEIVGGSTPSKTKPQYYTNKGIAWLTPKDLSVTNCKFTEKGETDITLEGYNSCSTKLMPKGSVLFSSRAPIGYITIAKNDICTNQGFKSVIPKLAGTAFIYYFLKLSTPDIENKATGSTFKEASGSLMKSLPSIIPLKSVLDSFEESLKPIFSEQELLESESRRLASLRDTLLPRLMSGELKVNDIENAS